MKMELIKGQVWKPRRGVCVAVIDEVLPNRKVRVIKRGDGFTDRTVDILISSLRRDYTPEQAP